MTGTFIPGSVVDVIRSRGINVIQFDGSTPTRAASRGGFVANAGVVMHHTADALPHNIRSNTAFATINNITAPEYNFMVDNATGDLWWCASGGVNSSGRGGPLTLATSTVPQDGANYRLVAISMDINGLGEPTSNKAFLSAVVCAGEVIRWQGRQVGDITAHKEWCGPGTSTPGRKIDPFGPIQDSASFSGKDWGPQQGRIDFFRGEVWWYLSDPAAYINTYLNGAPPAPEPIPPQPTPTPPPQEKVFAVNAYRSTVKQGTQGKMALLCQQMINDLTSATGGPGIAEDRNFGSQSVGALKTLQTVLGVPSDGVCGPVTWQAMEDGVRTQANRGEWG